MTSPSANSRADRDLQAGLARIEQLLSENPAAADERAAELLAQFPGHPMATLFRGIARRLSGDPASASRLLAPLCESVPDAPLPHLQLGLALREQGEREQAVRSMRRAIAAKPDFGDAWLALADLLTELGDAEAADDAYCTYISHAAGDPRLAEPAAALRENRLAEAGERLQSHLQRYPNDVAALCMLADVTARQARFDSAETLLARCLELAPSYRTARHNYAVVLMRQNKPDQALREVERLLATQSDSALRSLQATVLVRLVRYEEAIEVYETLLREQPDDPGVWASFGHALRTVGQLERSVDAYRKATALAPQFGEAYWNLANLKTFPISDEELDAMRAQLEDPALGVDDRIHFHFAIGKATEDRCSFEESFRHYAEGNRLQREKIDYDADLMSRHVSRCRALFTPGFFADRAGYGAADPDPIFIVGLPRAGSTLVEQILASHSSVEGTMELPHMTGMAKSLADAGGIGDPARFVETLADLDREAARELGRSYLERTRAQRRAGTPFFIDKMPNNFAHIGLIHLILPNARIIDARRHPLACSLSLFKQLFAHGQHFSYSLEDIARYYRDYVELMAHFDAVLPGRVYRVVYETLVDDTEQEVRRLLAHCKLPFEDACLNFYENVRAVSTPSSEQVRSPIFRDGLDHWRNYERWLEPLKERLGPLGESYPSMPAGR